MEIRRNFKKPIPEGYRIYESEFDIAGLGYRKKALIDVLKKG